MKRILLVDDDPLVTRLLKLNLERTGRYRVRIEAWGANALRAAREFRPDLVILDYVMPDLDGLEVARRLKFDPGLRGLPIVFLTALIGRQEAETGVGTIDGFPCFAKPLGLRGVVDLIEKHTPAAASLLSQAA
jgi:CheY-like chemotaxis protein